MEEKLLEVRNLSKRFPGVLALDQIDFDLYKGEVLGICGENGAGKSTLIKCLSGVYQPSGGTIKFQGKEVSIGNEEDGIALGISVIYQELSVIKELDIAQNVFLGRLPHHKSGWIDFKKLNYDAKEIMDHIGLNFNIKTQVEDISISAQQMVEIGKAISRNPKVLIMDEPTSSLGTDDIDRLFRLIEKLRSEGYGIIYISHHMEEIFRITNRVFVLRDGKGIATRRVEDWDVSSIVHAMVNRDVNSQYPKKSFDSINRDDCPALEVKGLTNRYVHDISFSIRKGEIVGLAGIVGAGRSEVLKSVFGAYYVNKGEIKINGKNAKIRHPKDALKRGIGFLSEDRKHDMLCLMDSVRINYVLPYFHAFSRRFIVSKRKIDKATKLAIERYEIKTPSMEQMIIQLSGGNQQKVLIARVTYGKPDIYFLDEPTRGIDVSVKQEIYKEIISMAENGSAVVLVTSELPEIIGLSDRVLVMRNHTIEAELTGNQISQEIIMSYATGGSLV